MTQCLRVATCVLRESIPSSSSAPRGKLSTPTRQVLLLNAVPPTATSVTVAAHSELVKAAFSSFADLADIYPQPMREELYAIAFHFYSRAYRVEHCLHSLLLTPRSTSQSS